VSTPDPQAILDRLQSRATRHETPCGAGRMVWHAWGDGPPLVLLHGGTGSWRHWVRNIEAFADHRRVVCADLPGLGCSDMPPNPEDPPAMAAILARGLDEVIGPDGLYDVAGFSYGGVMAGVLAARDQGRVRSLTIVGSDDPSDESTTSRGRGTRGRPPRQPSGADVRRPRQHR
jgi:2-hydroxy-6-oxonona-2,4-dienedioate hydrolase